MYQTQAQELMKECVLNRIPALFTGEPGVGKTAMARAVADELYGPPAREEVKLPSGRVVVLEKRPYFHSEHLAGNDPTDLPGIPYVAEGKLKRSEPDWLIGMVAEEGVFMADELGQAPMAVQNVAMRLVHEGRIGFHEMKPGWAFLSATNDTHHRAGAGQLNRALLGRFPVRVDVEVDPAEFRKIALKLDFDSEVLAFLAFKPTATQAYDPEKKSSPTCRGWEQVSDIQKKLSGSQHEFEVFSGVLGEGTGREFVAFKRLRSHVIPFEEIMKDPAKCKLPSENKPDLIYATIGTITGHLRKAATPQELDAAVVYGKRLPVEFGLVLARDLFVHHKEVLLTQKSMRDWIRENKTLLAG